MDERPNLKCVTLRCTLIFLFYFFFFPSLILSRSDLLTIFLFFFFTGERLVLFSPSSVGYAERISSFPDKSDKIMRCINYVWFECFFCLFLTVFMYFCYARLLGQEFNLLFYININLSLFLSLCPPLHLYAYNF